MIKQLFKKAIVAEVSYMDSDVYPFRVTEIYFLGILMFKRKRYVARRIPPTKS